MKLKVISFMSAIVLFLLCVVSGCPNTDKPSTTTTTVSNPVPSNYQGVYFIKSPFSPPPSNPTKMTITATNMIQESWDSTQDKYIITSEGNISFKDNIFIIDIKKIYANNELKSLPLKNPDGSELSSYVLKLNFLETTIGGKKCYYITGIYNGGDINTLQGEWKNQSYSEEMTYKIPMGNTYYNTYLYYKMPIIKFTSDNKMIYHGYKYASESMSSWKWYNIDLTADVSINTTNKQITLTNIIDMTTDYHSPHYLTEDIDYPKENYPYFFEKVDNSLVIMLLSTNFSQSNNIFYLEKQ